MSLDRFSTPDFINTLKLLTAKLSAMILAVIVVVWDFQVVLLD